LEKSHAKKYIFVQLPELTVPVFLPKFRFPENALAQVTGAILLQRHGRELVTVPTMPVSYVKAWVTTPSHSFAVRSKVSSCKFRGQGFGLPPPFPKLWSVFVSSFEGKHGKPAPMYQSKPKAEQKGNLFT
jgi:lipoprotein-anchoring transpeptidase ErfK/SrfK